MPIFIEIPLLPKAYATLIPEKFIPFLSQLPALRNLCETFCALAEILIILSVSF